MILNILFRRKEQKRALKALFFVANMVIFHLNSSFLSLKWQLFPQTIEVKCQHKSYGSGNTAPVIIFFKGFWKNFDSQ